MSTDIQGQLVLAQNQYALIQDTTKGGVAVNTGPHAMSLSPNDKPVIYDPKTESFRVVSISEAVKQNPRAPEGHYLILDNPAFDNNGALLSPDRNTAVPQLQTGRKINIPGPVTFALWPGQGAKVVPGHHMRSNQYLMIRVYNAEEANKNCPKFLKEDLGGTDFDNGELLVIKGTEVSFFIPPTGFEALTDTNGSSYVREALTLERLEYCILLDEDGNKRYAHGPQVVFPEATEIFVLQAEEASTPSRKFKMIELNDQMGLYIKVIADYEEYWRDVTKPIGNRVEVPPTERQGREVIQRDDKLYTLYKTGEELFITGKEQRIYCPRAEHALITYFDATGLHKKQRYYGIAIPRGEGRYILDKITGEVKQVTGPQIFLPDPRTKIVVRRVLDDRTVQLWYPGNPEALEFNRHLRSLTSAGENYVFDNVVRSSKAIDMTGTHVMSLGAVAASSSYVPEVSSGRFQGDELSRRSTYTPPPSITLDTKYDGVPSVTIWTGYAVQIVNRVGDRRVVVGPTTTLLQYDETLEVLELSTGKPKNTDHLHRDVYLRIDHNLVSDVVQVETKDLVPVQLRVSYRVNFLREHRDKWFNVENYVKYLCDHLRSVLKGSAKRSDIKSWTENSAELVRGAVLGEKKEGVTRSHIFPENGMEVYDVEVLGVDIADQSIKELISRAQHEAVQGAIRLGTAEQKLELTRREVVLNQSIMDLETGLAVKKEEFNRQTITARAGTVLASLAAEITEEKERLQAQVDHQAAHSDIAEAELGRKQAALNLTLTEMRLHTEMFEKRMAAITPNLVQALLTLGHTEFATKLSQALAPLALTEQQGLGQTMERVFRDTPLEPFVANLKKANGLAAGS